MREFSRSRSRSGIQLALLGAIAWLLLTIAFFSVLFFQARAASPRSTPETALVLLALAIDAMGAFLLAVYWRSYDEWHRLADDYWKHFDAAANSAR